MLSSLHKEVHSLSIGAIQGKAPVGCGMPPHNAHIGAKALQVYHRVRGHLCRP